MKNTLILTCTALLTANVHANNLKSENEKLADDPTRVTTQIGVSYSDNFDTTDNGVSFSGSLAIGAVKKINVRINDDASEWRIGGSWLFDIGIVNFNFGENEFEDGSTQTNYSIGTFMPLSYFGIEPWGIQIFPMAGYTYNDGENLCDVRHPGSDCYGDTPKINEHFVMESNQNHSGYVGAFALKPLSEKWTLMASGGGSAGSNDFSGYWVAAGAGYKVSKHQSLNLYSFMMDNSYGDEEKFGFSYKYQF